MSDAHTLIVGIGSPHGDDRAGWLLAKRLAAAVTSPNVKVRQARSPLALLDWLHPEQRLIVCDACHGLGRPGRTRHWTWPSPEFEDVAFSGTHDFSLPAVLQLAGRLGKLPPRVDVWGVEATAGVQIESALSPEVAAVLPQVVRDIMSRLTVDAHTQDETCTNSRS